MNSKKIVITMGIVLLVIALVPLVATALFFEEFSKNLVVAQGQEIVKTSLGDEFLFSYVTTNFPDLDTNVDVYDVNRKVLGYYLLGDQSFVKPIITVQIDSISLRCYELPKGLLIYRFNDGAFKGIHSSEIDDEYLTKNKPEVIKSELIELGKAMVAKNEWKWIKFFGRFLMKVDDSEMTKTLERYAIDQFTQEELDLNKDGEIKKVDMQAFAKQALELK